MDVGDGESSAYIMSLASSPSGYGIPPVAGEPSSLIVERNGVAVPYSNTNGFTYDADNNAVLFHGTWRPTVETAGQYEVSVIGGISQPVPAGAFLYDVKLNGESVPTASSNNGDGYAYENGVISLLGEYLPSADDDGDQTLTIEYFSSPNPITLQTTEAFNIPEEILNILPHLRSGTEKEDIRIYINGANDPLRQDQFEFDNNQVTIDFGSVQIANGAENINIEIEYDVFSPTNVPDNLFSIQDSTHNNLGQLSYDLIAFENVILDIYQNVRLGDDKISIWSDQKRFEDAIQRTASEEAKLGAAESRLDQSYNALFSSKNYISSARSRIMDADYAAETTALAKAEIMKKSAFAIFAQANNMNTILVKKLLSL
jgi:hypothetical protein